MERTKYLDQIRFAFNSFDCVCLFGPRQVGKTTIARHFAEKLRRTGQEVLFLDLEDPTDLARLSEAKLFLSPLSGMVIIDEIQRAPDLFPVLRVLLDREKNPLKLLLLGSASRELISQSSESLAGRIVYREVFPFSLDEKPLEQNGDKEQKTIWVRGGFPRSLYSETDAESLLWRKQYIRTFLEQDIPALGLQIPAQSLRRFWLMLVHYHGSSFNASEIGSALGVGDTTVRRYLDILSQTFMIRQLTPWLESIGKRQVKSPKIFFRDTGILHALLDIESYSQLHLNPKLGSSWEGFALEQVIQTMSPDNENIFFWGIHQQAELDLLIIKSGKRLGFEIKHTLKPQVTPSLQKAITYLKLDEATIVYPGEESFPLAEGIWARPLRDI